MAGRGFSSNAEWSVESSTHFACAAHVKRNSNVARSVSSQMFGSASIAKEFFASRLS